MAVINTGNTPKLLWPGLNAVWGRDYEEHPKEFPTCSTSKPRT
jgi:hypothetical protein